MARITPGEPPGSMEESSVEVDMEDTEEEEKVLAPAGRFTLQQAETHYNAVMEEAHLEE